MIGWILLIAGLLLLFWGYILPRHKNHRSKQEDIVAYYLEMALHLPAALWSMVCGLILTISGLVLII